MKFAGSLLAFSVTLLWLYSALATPNSVGGSDPLWSLYSQADFFALQNALSARGGTETDDIVFLRAATHSAFAQPEASARILEQLLKHPIANTALDIQARELLMLNDRTMFRYREALDAISPVLRGAQRQSGLIESIENRARLLRALADVGLQSVTAGNRTLIFPDGRGRIAVLIGHRIIPALVDTGANLSVMPSHIANSLGLKIRPANYSVGSSVGGRVKGDAAVADLLFADGTRIHNAIFLVLPDSAVPVTLLGYPVLSALGSIKYSGGGIIFGSHARNDTVAQLELSGNDLLLMVKYGGQNILCRLDSGSGRTVFYAPFYRRFRSSLPAYARKSLRVGGATGTYNLGSLQIPSLTITVAGRAFQVSPATVLTEPVQGVPNGAVACNIGRDVLRNVRDYRSDFTNMTLSFGP